MSARASGGEKNGPCGQAVCPLAPAGFRLVFGPCAEFQLPRHGPLAGQPQRKAHGQRHGEQRGAAIRDERQGHALGREQADIHGHVDQSLQAEQHDEPRHRVPDEAVGLLRRLGQTTQHDEGEQSQQNQAGNQAILFGRHGKDKVGVGVGKHVLHRPLARPSAEPAAMEEGIERPVGLIGVAGGRIEEAVDARGDVGHEQIAGDKAANAERAERGDPDHVDAGHIEQRAPDQRDEKRLAEIRLKHEQQREDRVKQDGELKARHVLPLLALVEQPGGEHDEGRLHEFGRLERERRRTEASAWRP